MDLAPITNLNNENLAPEHLKEVLNKRGRDQEIESAQEFEALFVQSMLKEMRPKTEEDGLFNTGLSEDVFMQMMDEALAKEIAKSPNNFGIAQSVMKQNFAAE